MLNNIIKTAQKAGEAIMSFYTDDIKVVEKEDNSPLTKADLAAHHIIVDALKELDPDTPVISEESGVPEYEVRKSWEKFWIVDPLDGTKEFIKMNGEFTVNIALIDHGVPVLGVVYAPARELLYYATRENGSYKAEGGGTPARIYSEKADQSRPLTIIRSRSHGSDKLEQTLREQGITVGESIAAGSSLKFCLLAEGKADVYPRLGPTMEWDVAAGDCVYRYSSRNGQHESSLKYNKPDLLNEGFILGL